MDNPFYNSPFSPSVPNQPQRTPVIQNQVGAVGSPPRTPILAKPFTECDSCGGYTQVGQKVTMIISGYLDFDPNTGMFIIVSESGRNVLAQFPAEREPDHPPVMDTDCSAEYCHDNLTNEPCGNNDDAYCVSCGDRLNAKIEED